MNFSSVSVWPRCLVSKIQSSVSFSKSSMVACSQNIAAACWRSYANFPLRYGPLKWLITSVAFNTAPFSWADARARETSPQQGCDISGTMKPRTASGCRSKFAALKFTHSSSLSNVTIGRCCKGGNSTSRLPPTVSLPQAQVSMHLVKLLWADCVLNAMNLII